MRKTLFIGASLSIALTSCVSKKKFTALENDYRKCDTQLSIAKLELASCLSDKEMRAKEIDYLRSTNYELLHNIGNLSTLSHKEAENLERSLESIKEKDLQIKSMRDALSKKDSVTLALVTSLKGATVGMDDADINIEVEKGVVFVSISDKLLFKSGSFEVSESAKAVLGKVAKVVKGKSDFDIMIEGHTDSVAYQNSVLQDNWDLSVKRATSIVRILQNDFEVNPKRMTAAGRSYYVPIADNTSKEGRAKNRRTKIILIPKLDQFYDMIEKEMDKLK